MVLLETNNYLLNKYFAANKFTFEINKQISLNQNTVTGGQDKSGHQ